MPPLQSSSAEKITSKPASKWAGLAERVAKLKDGESIILEPQGNPAEEARKIRTGLNGLRACRLVRRIVKVVDGKIVITLMGTWPMLSAFKNLVSGTNP